MPRQPPTFAPQRPKSPQHRPKEADRQRTRALNTNSAEWKRIRQQVLVRDGYQCRACGRLVVGKQAHVDHVDGNDSRNELTNLQTLCRQGHSRKTFAEQRGVKWDGKCEREPERAVQQET